MPRCMIGGPVLALAAVACCVALSLLSCKADDGPGGDFADLVSANTRFGFNLFGELLGDEPTENLFISPSSVAFALTMAYNGADGETKAAMAEALELQGMSLDDINRANAGLMASLMAAEPAVELSIANSLWARQGVKPKPGFLAANEEFYAARVSELNFADPGASKTINGWVSDQTRGKIEEIVPDRIDPLTVLYIINAIYFKGLWDEPFDKAATRDHPFTLPGGREKTVAMMSRFDRFRYLKGEGFQAVSLPYKEERVSMYILLPDEDTSLAALCRQLNAESWGSWLPRLTRQQGTIELPRFRVEYEASLVAALRALGMGVAFTDAADFRSMYDDPVCITDVKHKTFVEVNEEGTEAAAATSVEVGITSVQPQQPFHMVVDRPFFCAIHDNETDTLLFLGTIVDPGEA